ncbi:hypothetical protein MRX96_033438 [Rhipicephalus microplus]
MCARPNERLRPFWRAVTACSFSTATAKERISGARRKGMPARWVTVVSTQERASETREQTLDVEATPPQKGERQSGKAILLSPKEGYRVCSQMRRKQRGVKPFLFVSPRSYTYAESPSLGCEKNLSRLEKRSFPRGRRIRAGLFQLTFRCGDSRYESTK